MNDDVRRCAAWSSYDDPLCRFWALLPGRLAARINNNSGRSAEKLLGEPKRDILSTICNNSWNFGKFHLSDLSVEMQESENGTFLRTDKLNSRHSPLKPSLHPQTSKWVA